MVASAPSPTTEWAVPEAVGRATALMPTTPSTRHLDVSTEVANRRPRVGAAVLLAAGDALAAMVAGALALPLDAWAALVPLGWIGLLGAHDAYRRGRATPLGAQVRRVVRAGLALTFGLLLLAAATGTTVSAAGLTAFAAATTAVSVGLRGLAASVGRSRTTRVVVVGDRQGVDRMLSDLAASGSSFSVAHACLLGGDDHGLPVPASAGLVALRPSMERAGADAVIVVPSRHLDPAGIRRLGWELEQDGTQLLVATALPELDDTRVSLGRAGAVPLLHVRHAELAGARRVAKQIGERAVAACALVLLAPLLLTLAALVRLESSGPALFRQTRVGRNGRPFTMVKLRTMCADAETRRSGLTTDAHEGGVLFKMRSDPRVTRVGRFLRTYSLDELPQLLNVVRGDMALVGPRPPLPSEVEQYDVDARRRLAVTPGLTGLWQVSGRSDLSWEESVRLDLRYVENWSIGLDLRIIARTFGAVLGHRGAY